MLSVTEGKIQSRDKLEKDTQDLKKLISIKRNILDYNNRTDMKGLLISGLWLI